MIYLIKIVWMVVLENKYNFTSVRENGVKLDYKLDLVPVDYFFEDLLLRDLMVVLFFWFYRLPLC